MEEPTTSWRIYASYKPKELYFPLNDRHLMFIETATNQEIDLLVKNLNYHRPKDDWEIYAVPATQIYKTVDQFYEEYRKREQKFLEEEMKNNAKKYATSSFFRFCA